MVEQKITVEIDEGESSTGERIAVVNVKVGGVVFQEEPLIWPSTPEHISNRLKELAEELATLPDMEEVGKIFTTASEKVPGLVKSG